MYIGLSFRSLVNWCTRLETALPAWPLAAGTKNGVTIAAPQDFKMLCGKACWLIRQSSSNPVYLYGQVTNVLRSVEVSGATGGNAYGYTLIAKPSESSALDLYTWHPLAANMETHQSPEEDDGGGQAAGDHVGQ